MDELESIVEHLFDAVTQDNAQLIEELLKPLNTDQRSGVHETYENIQCRVFLCK